MIKFLVLTVILAASLSRAGGHFCEHVANGHRFSFLFQNGAENLELPAERRAAIERATSLIREQSFSPTERELEVFESVLTRMPEVKTDLDFDRLTSLQIVAMTALTEMATRQAVLESNTPIFVTTLRSLLNLKISGNALPADISFVRERILGIGRLALIQTRWAPPMTDLGNLRLELSQFIVAKIYVEGRESPSFDRPAFFRRFNINSKELDGWLAKSDFPSDQQYAEQKNEAIRGMIAKQVEGGGGPMSRETRTQFALMMGVTERQVEILEQEALRRRELVGTQAPQASAPVRVITFPAPNTQDKIRQANRQTVFAHLNANHGTLGRGARQRLAREMNVPLETIDQWVSEYDASAAARASSGR